MARGTQACQRVGAEHRGVPRYLRTDMYTHTHAHTHTHTHTHTHKHTHTYKHSRANTHAHTQHTHTHTLTRTHTGAETRGGIALASLTAAQTRPQLPVFVPELAALSDEEPDSVEAVEIDTSPLPLEYDLEGTSKAGEDGVLQPRSQDALYRGLCTGLKLWQRPPDDYCSRCTDHAVKTARSLALTTALAGQGDDALMVVTNAGGRIAAAAEQRALLNDLEDGLDQHVEWRKQQRFFVQCCARDLKPHQLLLYLDYGGFNDSAGRKVNCWSASVLSAGRQKTPDHIDFFFDSGNQQQRGDEAGHKKDAKAGIYFLNELVDPKRDPVAPASGGLQASVARLRRKYPASTHLILSGDTGNGFRGYEMLDFLSQLQSKFGFTVELIPLAPKHAFNLTDGRIATMNTFLRGVKRVTRVLGAEQMAAAFHACTVGEQVKVRKFMQRCDVFFARVTDVVPEVARNRMMNTALFDPRLNKGKAGVMSLLYFNFSVASADGTAQHPAGFARVRPYGATLRMDNPTLLFCWRNDEMKQICQPCSTRLGRPVSLADNGCTKNNCAPSEAAQDANLAVVEEVAFPMHGAPSFNVDVEVVGAGRGCGRGKVAARGRGQGRGRGSRAGTVARAARVSAHRRTSDDEEESESDGQAYADAVG
jgi:hypothetical protein